MKNSDMIKKAFSEFDKNDYVSCQKTLERINRNFCEESDEFSLSIVAKMDESGKELAEKLIEKGKSHLVGDENYLKNKAYENKTLSIKINFRALEAYDVDEEGGEEGEEIHSYFHNGHIRFDKEGEIACMVAPGSIEAKYCRNEISALVKSWLNKEFGKSND